MLSGCSSIAAAYPVAADVKDWLRRYGFLQKLGEDSFYPTVGTAVSAYVAASGIDWVDWEERDPDAPGPSSGTSSST